MNQPKLNQSSFNDWLKGVTSKLKPFGSIEDLNRGDFLWMTKRSRLEVVSLFEGSSLVATSISEENTGAPHVSGVIKNSLGEYFRFYFSQVRFSISEVLSEDEKRDFWAMDELGGVYFNKELEAVSFSEGGKVISLSRK